MDRQWLPDDNEVRHDRGQVPVKVVPVKVPRKAYGLIN